MSAANKRSQLLATDVRPLCTRCDDTADRIVLKRPDVRITAWPYCKVHLPDPDEYGYSSWERIVVIERYDRPMPPITLYGIPGGEQFDGAITMHIAHPSPDIDGPCCHHDVTSRRTYNLSHAVGDGFTICTPCQKFGKVRDDIDEDLFEAFAREFRRVAHREGLLNRRARSKIEYPTPDPRVAHLEAEGLNGGDGS